MSLRGRISGAAWSIRLGVGGVSVVVIWCAIGPGSAIFSAIAWLIISGPLLRSLILPRLFPDTRCPGCRRTIPLFGRWKCGDHYIDHRERHVLTFYCAHGHRIEGFDCPRCRSTILVQRGDPQRLRHGTAVKLRTISAIPQAGSNALLIGHDRNRQPVMLPQERLSWHMAITGGTGRGKSTLLANMAVQLAKDGTGFSILDPGGDLARAVLQQIPANRESDVLYVDVGDRGHPFPLNILSARDEVEGAVLTEELLGVFHRLHGASWGPLLAHQFRMALRAVMTAGGTLKDVYSLFSDNAVRGRILSRVNDPDLRAFWTKEFPTIPATRRTAVTNKLSPVVFHPVLGKILCAQKCALDADKLIANQQILIVNLATGTPGDDVTTLLGTFLVQKILAATFRQTGIPAERRMRHVLIVDEFQRFMHRAAAFDQILAEARKYRLSLVVANQYVEQLATPVRAALFGNVGCLTAFRVGHRDASVLTPEFTGATPQELMELERGQCLVRIGSDWTIVGTPPPPVPPSDDPSGRIIEHSRLLAKPPEAQVEPPETRREEQDGGEFVQ